MCIQVTECLLVLFHGEGSVRQSDKVPYIFHMCVLTIVGLSIWNFVLYLLREMCTNLGLC